MDNQQFKEIDKSLKTIIRLIGIIAIKEKAPKEQVLLLNKLGLQPKEIAELLGKTPNAIRIALSRAKKSSKT